MSSNLPDKRKRQTPQEAEAERERLRQEELAARERRRQADRAIAVERQQALINAAPTTSDDRSDLDNVAYNLHNAYDWQGHADECVTAVVRLRNNTYVVFAQRYMTAMEEYGNQHYSNLHLNYMPGGGSHLHAEMYAMFNYLANEQVPSEQVAEIGVSKPICPQCQYVLNYLGINYNARWVTADTSKNWINPWDILTKTCKPAVKNYRKDGSEDDDDGKGGPGKGFGPLGSPLLVNNNNMITT